MYSLPTEDRGQAFDVPAQLEGLPDMKPEDQQYFGALLKVRSTQSPACCVARARTPCAALQRVSQMNIHVYEALRGCRRMRVLTPHPGEVNLAAGDACSIVEA